MTVVKVIVDNSDEDRSREEGSGSKKRCPDSDSGRGRDQTEVCLMKPANGRSVSKGRQKAATASFLAA